MTEPNYSVGFSARLIATDGCAVGDALVYDSDAELWKIATASVRSTLGKRTEAIALTAYGGSVIGKVGYQASGTLAAAER